MGDDVAKCRHAGRIAVVDHLPRRVPVLKDERETLAHEHRALPQRVRREVSVPLRFVVVVVELGAVGGQARCLHDERPRRLRRAAHRLARDLRVVTARTLGDLSAVVIVPRAQEK